MYGVICSQYLIQSLMMLLFGLLLFASILKLYSLKKASNTNHTIEQYQSIEQQQSLTTALPSKQLPAIILLSAKTAEQLMLQARNLLTFIKTHKLGDQDLLNMAYSLQIGRQGMLVRAATQVTGIKALKRKLINLSHADQNSFHSAPATGYAHRNIPLVLHCIHPHKTAASALPTSR